MKTEFSQSQIRIGRRLVEWLRGKGVPHDMARAEVRGIILSFPVEKIEKSIRQVNCTSLQNLKIILTKHAQSSSTKQV